MRCFSPDPDSPTGEDASRQLVGAVPSDMDNDPNADEEIIDQRAGHETARDKYPRPADAPKTLSLAAEAENGRA